MSLFGTYGPTWRSHVCGLYYTKLTANQYQKFYLPQVEVKAHTSILSTASRTTLVQTFINPSETNGIRKVTYTFPLYDGVSVVGFTCNVGGRTIVGEVKEKDKARAVFNEAIAKGETAGLLEQLPDASDVFTTTVGNVPPGAKVEVQIAYLGELKHDMEVDGIRFTIPNVICPRYGNYPIALAQSSTTSAQGKGISITVDAEMPDGSFIQQIRSPSHPIAISMGTTSIAPDANPVMNKASATLSLGSAQLDTDFVLELIAKDTGVPKALLETHPTIPNHRALMVTLVPKFALPPENPEIVFVCDRSGSMSGSRIKLVVQALKIFLKSLPVGVKFNICSFGSSYSFLWPKSVSYNQQNLDHAVKHAEEFDGNYGGTEMLAPMQATIQNRYKDIPLEVMLLTDGEIWRTEEMFNYLNKEVTEAKAPIRVFTLGIGNGVSHALVEGIAKAGNGFSQVVGEGEKMDSKVVRMLKGALSPHVNDYALEVKYADKMTGTEEEDDFEIIEKVADSLTVKLSLDEKQEQQEKGAATKKSISLFDPSVDVDNEVARPEDGTGESRYGHLPKLAVPRVIQAPQNIPSLFSFNRTTVYLLFGPDAPQGTPKSIVLRGTSAHGPLELEIPVEILETRGETIHQLAAKKGISELEQGRGWLPAARTEAGKPVKEAFESRYEDMVEREAVRLGVQFQVGGKWCSFVAVEKAVPVPEKVANDWLDDAGGIASGPSTPYGTNQKYANSGAGFQAPSFSALVAQPTGFFAGSNSQLFSTPMASYNSFSPSPPPPPIMNASYPPQQSMLLGSFQSQTPQSIQGRHSYSNSNQFQPQSMTASVGFGSVSASTPGTGFGSAAAPSPFGSAGSSTPYSFQYSTTTAPPLAGSGSTGSSGGLFGSSSTMASASSPYSSPPTTTPSGGLFGNSSSTTAPAAISRYSPTASGGLFGSPSTTTSGGPFGNASTTPSASLFGRPSTTTAPAPLAFGSTGSSSNLFGTSRTTTAPAPSLSSPPGPPQHFGGSSTGPKEDKLAAVLYELVGLQTFDGFWEWNARLLALVGVDEAAAESGVVACGFSRDVAATALAVAFLEERLGSLRASWELVGDKARAWLGTHGDEAVRRARHVLGPR